MDQLQQTLQPHRSNPDEHDVDLYHVYDNLSRTPYQHGIGIECEDADEYPMGAWHVITPSATLKHLDWRNRNPTQFVSFYNSVEDAIHEQQRRRNQPYVQDVGYRNPASVRIAHVRLPRNTNVWAFSRAEMLPMMGIFGGQVRLQTSMDSAPGEWFVWGFVPDELVQNRRLL